MRIGESRTRTLVCTLFAGSITVACAIQSNERDSTKTSSAQAASTATSTSKVTSDVTFLSARTVASGEFNDTTLIRKILDTARTLTRSDWDNVHSRRDERRLLTGDCSVGSNKCMPGPFARIVARKNIHQTRVADLGKGHIVGRIMNLETNYSIPYIKLALYGGTAEAYWWIGVHANPSKPAQMDTLSVYVPVDWSAAKAARWRIVGMVRTDPKNPAYTHSHSSARFVWNDNDDESWVSCVANGCCEPPMAMRDSLSTSSRTMLDAIESR